MQLIDDTPLGVRSAVMSLERSDSLVRFVTIPMVHIGTPDFYGRVQRLLSECDVVVVEGVAGRRASLLTTAYRFAIRFRQTDLILQSDGLDLGALPGQIVRPDMSAKEFGASWSRLRWWWRIAILLAAPIVGFWIAMLGPERVLRGSMTVDQIPAFHEIDHPLDEVLLHDRDRLLCAELTRLATQPSDAPITVGVCWGASHVRAVWQTLGHDLGYRIVDAAWLTIF